jgi:hypothetical protein
MPHGTTLSKTLNILSGKVDAPEHWADSIQTGPAREHRLKSEVPSDLLSADEIGVLEAIFQEYGEWSDCKLRNFTHTLPEYTETSGSISISHRELLAKAGVDSLRAEETMKDIEARRRLHAVLAGL